MKRPVIPILLAVALAIGAGLAVFIYARGAEARALADQQPVDVLVSTQLIPMGTTLGDAVDDGLAETAKVPVTLRPRGSFPEVTTANADLVALSDVSAGQVLLAGAFGTEVPKAVPLEVPDGLVAVSAALEDPAKVGPFLRPGSEIAVFDTITLPNENTDAPPIRATRLLLDRVLVLAVGPVTERQAESAEAEEWQAQLVTLALNQVQAQKLIHGIETGALYMALLGENTTLKPSVGVSDADLFN